MTLIVGFPAPSCVAEGGVKVVAGEAGERARSMVRVSPARVE